MRRHTTPQPASSVPRPSLHIHLALDQSTATTRLGAQPVLCKPPGIRLGIGLTCASPELAQLGGHAGLGMVLIDMEHGPVSVESASRMVTALAGAAAEAWISVTHNDAPQIKRALDTGARTVMVPRVTTQAEGERAVSAAQYPSQGMRGRGPFRPQYPWRTGMLDQARRANTETSVLVLIEPPRAIENLDAILSAPGLGGAIAVPFDLALNMGFSDGPHHPAVQQAIAHASKKIAAQGFPLCRFAVTPEQGQAAMARGATLLFLGFDTLFFPAAVQDYLGLLQSAGSPLAPAR